MMKLFKLGQKFLIAYIIMEVVGFLIFYGQPFVTLHESIYWIFTWVIKWIAVMMFLGPLILLYKNALQKFDNEIEAAETNDGPSEIRSECVCGKRVGE